MNKKTHSFRLSEEKYSEIKTKAKEANKTIGDYLYDRCTAEAINPFNHISTIGAISPELLCELMRIQNYIDTPGLVQDDIYFTNFRKAVEKIICTIQM